jgi:hypothetical protein
MMKITCGSFFPLKLEFFARFGFNRPWKPEEEAVETAELEGGKEQVIAGIKND